MDIWSPPFAASGTSSAKLTGGTSLKRDGDKRNCKLDNPEFCHPHDAFTNADWVVDWDAELTEAEIEFERANLRNFATIYQDA